MLSADTKQHILQYRKTVAPDGSVHRYSACSCATLAESYRCKWGPRPNEMVQYCHNPQGVAKEIHQ